MAIRDSSFPNAVERLLRRAIFRFLFTIPALAHSRNVKPIGSIYAKMAASERPRPKPLTESLKGAVDEKG